MYSLKAEIAELVRARIVRALVTCDGNKTAAAELLGLGSYQTLTNWMLKYGVICPGELVRERLVGVILDTCTVTVSAREFRR